MKRECKQKQDHTKHKNTAGERVNLNTTDVIKICLTCPLPKCVNANKCQRYAEEIKKLKENA